MKGEGITPQASRKKKAVKEPSALPNRIHHASIERQNLELDIFTQLSASDAIRDTTIKTVTNYLPAIWDTLSQALQSLTAQQHKKQLALLFSKHKEIELIWTDNPTIQTLNTEYRKKNKPTDVLTFNLLTDTNDTALWTQLPVIQMGTIVISIEYAQQAIQQLAEKASFSLEHYLVERFIHGVLHLYGIHHDTTDTFQQVVQIQQSVLRSVFKTTQLVSPLGLLETHE